jgi:hypothetical protein
MRTQLEVQEKQPSYSYQPLGLREIRLVQLLPGKGDEPVEGRIIHTSFDAGAQYFAISYVWNPALKPYNFKTDEDLIPITSSLHSALKRIRSEDSPRWL